MSDPVVSPDWLARHRSDVVILDATYYLPPDPQRTRRDFEAVRIPGARLFEIDEIANKNSDLPHMLPDALTFSDAMAQLGIDGSRPVVVYDRSPNHFSAPRVWLTLRLFGVPDVRVLDGGLTAWTRAKHATEGGPEATCKGAVRRMWSIDSSRVLDGTQMAELIAENAGIVIDARSAERFAGRALEPRPGLKSGHMPGSLNIPFDAMTSADGRFLDMRALSALFGDLNGKSPVVTCGSGMTACVLALGLSRVGIEARLYDGSWAEWGRATFGPINVSTQ